MSWIVAAYEALPEEARSAFLQSLNPVVFSGVTFDDDKREHRRLQALYDESCKRMRSVEDIESHIKTCDVPPPLHVSETSNDERERIHKACNPWTYLQEYKGLYFDSIGEIVKKRTPGQRPFFYFRNDPSCIKGEVPTSKTFEIVRDMLHATYGVDLVPVKRTNGTYYTFNAHKDGRIYFEINIGRRGANLGTDYLKKDADLEAFSKPFTVQ